MGRIVTRAMPVNLDPREADFFRLWESGELPVPEVRQLDRVWVDPRGVLHRGWRLLPESFPDIWEDAPWRWEWDRHRAWKRRVKGAFTRLRAGRPERVRDPSLWISDTWTYNYHHWIQDALPRLFLVEGFWSTHPVVLPADYASRPYVGESLGAFDGLRVRYLGAGRSARFDRLAVPLPVARVSDYDHGIMGRLRSLMVSRFGSGTQGTNPRIYVSRARAGCRRVSNEDQVRLVLEGMGFKIVCAEVLTFGEQVALFAGARVVVGPHGAGLTNVAWMQPGACVLEIRPARSRNRAYFNLAAAVGVRYAYLLAGGVAADRDEDDWDLVVPPDDLVREIGGLLGGAKP